LAWDTNLQVRIAIKEFLPRQLASRASGGTQVYPYTGGQEAFNIGLDQFLSEARNLAQFRDHPGIISVLDFFPENGTGYMVMEYLDGSTLEQYMTATGRLEIPVILQLLVPVADALRACHSAGLIHRDISPDNIFLTSDGRVKVLDFGAARFAIGSRSTNLSVILKEGYAPFEQYQRNGRQGPWTDIYALTATLYRQLTGDLPATAPDRVGGMPLASPAEKGVKLPPGLQALLDKGLAIRSEQRYQTIDAFLSDLQAVLQAVRGTPTVVRRDGRRRILIIILVGAIGLMGGVAALFWPPLPSIPVGAVPPNPPPSIPVGAVPPNPPPSIPVVAVPPNPPPSIPVVAVPPNPPPRVLPTISTESAREYVKRAAEYQIRLRHAAARARGASSSLEKLRAITVKPQPILDSIQTQENIYNSAIGEGDAFLNKYMAEVEWLGEHDTAAVEAALQLESDALATPSFDKGETEAKAQMGRAIKLLASHVRAQRQKQLKREKVTADAN
jgi:serine/threonine protein kinase